MIVARVVALCVSALGVPAMASSTAQADNHSAESVHRTTYEIPNLENDLVRLHVHRPHSSDRLPIVLVIDGSGCGGQLRPDFVSLLQPSSNQPIPFARLAVDKPGVDPFAQSDASCSQEYRERHSLDNWVFDHLRALQFLREKADWWNRQLYIFGWSEGGDVGARLTAYYPGVVKAVLGGVGGGYTMAETIKLFQDCAPDRTADREACVKEIDEWLADVRSRPLASVGRGDSYKLWRSRLFADLGTLLLFGDTSLLIVHGGLDRDSVPVQSARRLIARLSRSKRASITYCEIPTMGHGTGSLEPELAQKVDQALADFLFASARWETARKDLCAAPKLNH